MDNSLLVVGSVAFDHVKNTSGERQESWAVQQLISHIPRVSFRR